MPGYTWPGMTEAKAILTYLWAYGTEAQINQAIDDLVGSAPDCWMICELCDFIKEHGDDDQLERACDIAEAAECECGACNDPTP